MKVLQSTLWGEMYTRDFIPVMHLSRLTKRRIIFGMAQIKSVWLSSPPNLLEQILGAQSGLPIKPPPQVLQSHSFGANSKANILLSALNVISSLPMRSFSTLPHKCLCVHLWQQDIGHN